MVEGEAFEGEFDKRFDGTFLQEGLVVERKQGVQILPRESNVVYYRGVRIMDLQKPSLFTYNVLSAIDLTEDRTAKYTFQIEEEVRNELVGLDDRSMLEAVLNADETAWEHCLDFEGMRQTMSPEFILVGSESRNCTARKLIRNHDENWIAAQKAKHFTERLAEHITEGEWNKFRDLAEENQEELFQILVGLRPASWEPRAEMIIKSPTLYIVIGDNSTYGAFCNKEAANKRIEELHENGYFGELLVSEEEGCE
jgi:hypothetical protein